MWSKIVTLERRIFAVFKGVVVLGGNGGVAKKASRASVGHESREVLAGRPLGRSTRRSRQNQSRNPLPSPGKSLLMRFFGAKGRKDSKAEEHFAIQP